MNYISPNLPKSKVSLFIADTYIEGATVIAPPRVDALPQGLQKHADLGICIASKNKAVCPPDSYEYYKKALSPYDFEIIKGEIFADCHYPNDSAYNVCIVGKKCFLNKSVCDSVLFDILTSEGYEIINVKQGYTKCSICPVDENTIITADRGIMKEATEHGMDVLLISNDNILLPGYSNGFFGGCTGLSDRNELILNGEIKYLPQGSEIKDFLRKKGIVIKEIRKGSPLDIGSILPLMTE